MSVFANTKPYRMVAGDCAAHKISHAYLFVCPDGRNLRAFLKELAKLIVRADERACRLIDEEAYADCRIFPAAGEKTTVADVRELLDECYIKPVEGDCKLFVLDRVQDMLPPAQNKLLKILEEPPANVYFLLGATSEFSVLSTIKSRAKRLELYSFPQEEIESYIRKSYPYRADAKEIAAASDGILGRAQELAENGGEEDIALFALNFSPAGIPAAVRKYADKAEIGRFLPLFRLTLRDMLMLRLGREDLLLSGGDKKILRRAAAKYSAAALVRAQERICDTERDLKFNANAPASLEALLIGILEGR